MAKETGLKQIELGKRIHRLRDEIGLSQAAMADHLDIARQAVGQIEKGERKIDSLELIKLSSFLSISVEELLKPEEKSPRSIQTPKSSDYKFDPEKLRNLILFILEKCGGKPNLGETGLYKLLYFIDFEATELLGRPITGMPYVRLQYGPVPRKKEYGQVLQIMIEREELKIIAHEYYGHQQKRYVNLREPDSKIFSKIEEEIINRNLVQLSDMKAAEITHYVHGDIPWKKTVDGEVIEYNLAFQRELPYSRFDHGVAREEAAATDTLKDLGTLSDEEATYYKNL